VLGASFDTPQENLAFARAQHFDFGLLSDVARTVGAAYEVTRPADDHYAAYPQRITYVIAPDGRIAKAIAVTDVAGHAATVIDDLRRLIGP
jgi:peroxiredoxin Q/BCP